MEKAFSKDTADDIMVASLDIADLQKAKTCPLLL